MKKIGAIEKCQRRKANLNLDKRLVMMMKKFEVLVRAKKEKLS